MPAGEPRRCHQCGEPISFKKLASGKWTPCELDQSDHFDRCSRIRGEQVKREGKHFDRTGDLVESFAQVREEGYKWRGKDKFVQLDGLLIRGKDYKAPTHDCPTPPWDNCRCQLEGAQA